MSKGLTDAAVETLPFDVIPASTIVPTAADGFGTDAPTELKATFEN